MDGENCGQGVTTAIKDGCLLRPSEAWWCVKLRKAAWAVTALLMMLLLLFGVVLHCLFVSSCDAV